MMMKLPPLLLATTLLFAAAAFADRRPEDYEKVLVPVLPIPGWSASLWIHNDGDTPVDIFPLSHRSIGPSTGTLFPLAQPGVQPGETLDEGIPGATAPSPYVTGLSPAGAGAILYVERGKRRDVRFQLRVRGEVQVPVVPEESFSARPVTLLRVPVRAGHYYTLRVYSLDSDTADADVAVAAWNGPLRLSTHLRLQRDAATPFCAGGSGCWPDVPYAPAYAVLFFDSTRIPEETVDITVTSTSGAKLWAFLSETDAATKDVKVFTPD